MNQKENVLVKTEAQPAVPDQEEPSFEQLAPNCTQYHILGRDKQDMCTFGRTERNIQPKD